MPAARLTGPSMLALVGRERTGPDLVALAHSANRRLRDAERSGDAPRAPSARQEREYPLLDLQAEAASLPSPQLHVGHVPCVRAKVQMVGPAARGIVAAVADLQPSGNPPVGEAERDPMGILPPLTVPDSTVAMFVALAARPGPAAVRVAAIHAGPEAGSKIGVRLVAAGDRAEALRGIARLSGVGSAEEVDAAPLADQCDTLRGHQVSPSPGVTPPDCANSRGGFRMVIVP